MAWVREVTEGPQPLPCVGVKGEGVALILLGSVRTGGQRQCQKRAGEYKQEEEEDWTEEGGQVGSGGGGGGGGNCRHRFCCKGFTSLCLVLFVRLLLSSLLM